MKPPLLHLINLFTLTLIGGGCGAVIFPPKHPVNPIAVYVVDYGHHASVILPVGDTGYAEYAFGDWKWFALNQTTTANALRALFCSQGSAMGRRYTLLQPDSPGPSPIGQPRILPIDVAGADEQRVLEKLQTQWEASAAKEKVYNPMDEMEFVHDPRPYWWASNCNEWTASVLRDLGCRTEGFSVFSDFRLIISSDGSGQATGRPSTLESSDRKSPPTTP